MNDTTARKQEAQISAGGSFTMHGLQRTMEWLGMNREQAARCIENAWTRGKTMDDLKHSRQRHYLEVRDGRCRAGHSEFRLYQDHLFIFTPDQGMLITTYPTPRSFNRKRLYAGKERVRNVRRFCRMSPPTPDCCGYEDSQMMKGAYEL